MSLKDTFYGFTPLVLATGPAQKKKPEHTEIAKLLIAEGRTRQGARRSATPSRQATPRSRR